MPDNRAYVDLIRDGLVVRIMLPATLTAFGEVLIALGAIGFELVRADEEAQRPPRTMGEAAQKWPG